ncbi:uncharacterized protein HMPREF1541_00518 [Cyphellophora europaea CBS 101466]|uniref:Uncharacterized protein n=1 Tax=Cyphellophora europaea (strain CBS 101466) TaxID=1220924 RepID=W2SEJ7_CYPE1|nr:uncharacterized protein HMPREF1541_00518 [Cyphellophora europaea CBS 101466]ETN46334.1 hypothetical protein HMPREF1541_00518 [Cyphellophora europaea CBS 101466]
MPQDERRGPYMSRSLLKELDSEREREKKQEEAREEQEQMEQRNKEEMDGNNLIPVTLERGHHHCPFKDAATTHVLEPRCVDRKHMGVCPVCRKLVSSKYGCKKHGLRGDDQLYENIKFAFVDPEHPAKDAPTAPKVRKNPNKTTLRLQGRTKF